MAASPQKKSSRKAQSQAAAKRGDSRAESCCPITAKPRLRLASDQQTDSIRQNFPGGIARPALRALFAAGLMTLDHLTRISESELKALHGMGPKAVELLRTALHARGLDFRK